MRRLSYILMTFISISVFGQYPFEKYPCPDFDYASDWPKIENDSLFQFELVIDNFFDADDLRIKLSADKNYNNDSEILIKKGAKKICSFGETMFFNDVNVFDSIWIADFNGDGLKDIKMVFSYLGTGLAGMNVRVIYLIQKKDQSFHKISFDDKMAFRRVERDLNNDGVYEIITMTLNGFENHSYWTFNLYNMVDSDIICKNDRFNYPIMIQFLHRDNYEITNKISREKMKDFELKKPENLMIIE